MGLNRSGERWFVPERVIACSLSLFNKNNPKLTHNGRESKVRAIREPSYAHTCLPDFFFLRVFRVFRGLNFFTVHGRPAGRPYAWPPVTIKVEKLKS